MLRSVATIPIGQALIIIVIFVVGDIHLSLQESECISSAHYCSSAISFLAGGCAACLRNGIGCTPTDTKPLKEQLELDPLYIGSNLNKNPNISSDLSLFEELDGCPNFFNESAQLQEEIARRKKQLEVKSRTRTTIETYGDFTRFQREPLSANLSSSRCRFQYQIEIATEKKNLQARDLYFYTRIPLGFANTKSGSLTVNRWVMVANKLLAGFDEHLMTSMNHELGYEKYRSEEETTLTIYTALVTFRVADEETCRQGALNHICDWSLCKPLVLQELVLWAPSADWLKRVKWVAVNSMNGNFFVNRMTHSFFFRPDLDVHNDLRGLECFNHGHVVSHPKFRKPKIKITPHMSASWGLHKPLGVKIESEQEPRNELKCSIKLKRQQPQV